MTKNRAASYVKYALAGLGIVLTVLLVVFYRESRYLAHQNIIRSHALLRTAIEKRTPLAANNANLIQPWMTFGYVNKIFNLPEEYLKTTLRIADPHYPSLLIARYARANNLTVNTFTGDVKAAVEDYFSNMQ